MEKANFNRLDGKESVEVPYVVDFDYLTSGEVVYIYSNGVTKNADGLIVADHSRSRRSKDIK